MRNFSRVFLVVAVSAALVGSVALPATAAPNNVTVTVLDGGLTISDAGAAAFGPITPGATANVDLTGVTVTDSRAGTLGWQAAVSMSDLVSGANTIPASGATYTPAAAVVTGLAVVVPTTASDLTTAKNVQTAATVTGNNQAVWGATLKITVPSSALVGVYTGTLTNSFL